VVEGNAALNQIWIQAMIFKFTLAPRSREKAALILALFHVHNPDARQFGW
jgi:hypothetical protein